MFVPKGFLFKILKTACGSLPPGALAPSVRFKLERANHKDVNK